jgi:hypothetical protein
MPFVAAGSTEAARIDEALQHWRQGDVTFDALWFLHAGDGRAALTPAAAEATGEGPEALTAEADGLVVVTQTCDVVRSCTERPFVEVSPLVVVDEDRLREIQRGRRPANMYVPAGAARRLVGDLDRVMTVEKSLVAGWTRTPGWSTDDEGRAIAQSLARKRSRPAFPDDFVTVAKTLVSQLVKKHDKDSVEGRALRELREIRVWASPSWEAASISLFFHFVRSGEEVDLEGKGWSDMLNAWLALVPPAGRYKTVEGVVTSLDEMTARDYVESDRLDLDHLSRGAE